MFTMCTAALHACWDKATTRRHVLNNDGMIKFLGFQLSRQLGLTYAHTRKVAQESASFPRALRRLRATVSASPRLGVRKFATPTQNCNRYYLRNG